MRRAPHLGVGYRRCAEQLTAGFVKELSPTVWRRGIAFAILDPEPPAKLPVSERTVIDDNVGFRPAN